MEASMLYPIYTVYVISGGIKYNVTPALSGINTSSTKKQMAQSVTIQLMNVKVGNGWLTDILNVRDRVFIYANDGTREDEVFRGYIWTRSSKSSVSTRDIQIKCYTNLIYFQESEESAFYASGKSTRAVCQSLCDNWGVKLQYSYESITHAKLVLRGKLSDIFTEDILNLVKERTGKKYVILSEKDIICIKPVGSNSTIYHFRSGKDTTQTYSECTMDGMVTKVIIVGKADDEEREPIEATVSGKTSQYGTLQKIIDRSENTSLEDAKKEAQSIIDENGTPKYEDEIRTIDIPWVQLGDKVYVDAGSIKGYRIVTGIDRSIDNKHKEMTLTLEQL